MQKQVLKQIRALRCGALIRVEWVDASIGKSMVGGTIDVPVVSYGIYLGCLGEKHQHLILAQNSFRYSNGLYDVDYTAIPISWSLKITVVSEREVEAAIAQALLTSFLQGRCRTLKRRTSNHGP